MLFVFVKKCTKTYFVCHLLLDSNEKVWNITSISCSKSFMFTERAFCKYKLHIVIILEIVLPIFIHLICIEPFVSLFVSLIIPLSTTWWAFYLSLPLYFLPTAFPAFSMELFTFVFLLVLLLTDDVFLVPLSASLTWFFFGFSKKLASHQSEILLGWICSLKLSQMCSLQLRFCTQLWMNRIYCYSNYIHEK